MATVRDIRAFEAALQALLTPLAQYAKANGVGPARFAAMVARAARGQAVSIAPDLPYEAAVRLVSRWKMDPAFSTRGKAKALPLSGQGSFASLVRAARAGSSQRAREALVDSGVVVERGGQLHLRADAYVPKKGTSNKIDILGHAAAQFIRVLAHNVKSPPEQSLLQRVASYDSIGASGLMTLRKALRREGLGVLERANAQLALRDRDRNPRAPGGRRTRVSFGVYMLEEPVTSRRGR